MRTEHRSVATERLQGMNAFHLLTADWRIRLLAQITCASYRPIVLRPAADRRAES